MTSRRTGTAPARPHHRGAAVVAMLLAGTLGACGSSGPGTLDGVRIAAEVVTALDAAGIDAEVDCPKRREIQQGDGFDCDVVTKDGLEFEVPLTQKDDQGNVDIEINVTVLDRRDVEDAVAEALADELDDELTADCSDSIEEEQIVAEDGDELECTVSGETGLTADALATVDIAEGSKVSVELDGEPVIPTTTTSSTTTSTTTTSTTVPPTLPPTLPPVTLPPLDTEATVPDSTPPDSSNSQTVLFDSFDDNSSGWGEIDVPGLTITIDADTAEMFWFSDASADPNALPFELVPDAIIPMSGDLDDVDVFVDLTFGEGSVGGVSCMSSELGGYVFAVGSTRSFVGKFDGDRTLTELVSADTTFDTTESPIVVRASCFPTDEGTRLILAVDGEEVVSTDDPDGLSSGAAGIYGAWDDSVPVEARSIAALFFDNFEVRQF